MENASKALIIAGAILLSILIIALGMRIYNSASSSAGSADLSAQEVASHNAQFEAYAGRQKGTQVKTLLNLILSARTNTPDKLITVKFGSTECTTDTAIKDITPNDKTTYKVTFNYGGPEGTINYCTIEVNS